VREIVERGHQLRNADIGAWRRFLDERKLDPALALTWSKYARPNIRLVLSATLAEDNTIPRTSKLGGMPDLPVGATWPERPAYRYSRDKKRFLSEVAWEPQPLTFLAQINLSDIAEAGCDLLLPSTGLLLFFYDVEVQPWGFDPLDAPGSQVLFVSAETATQRQADPLGVPSRLRLLRFDPHEGLPGWEWVYEKIRTDPGYSHNAFHNELKKLSDQDISGSGHVFGGWPSLIQRPMELECEMVTSGVYLGDADTYDDPRMPEFRRTPRIGVCSYRSTPMTILVGCGATSA
jgi:uncharacterized protein YwqG